MPYYSHRMRRNRQRSSAVPIVIAVLVILAVIILARALWPDSSAVQNPPAAVAQFTLLSGKARIILAGGIETSLDPSQSPTSLNVGEGVETVGSTRLDVNLDNGASVKLDGNSGLSLLSKETKNGSAVTTLAITKGSGWIKKPESASGIVVVRGRISEATINTDSALSITRTAVSDTYRGIQGSSLVRVFDGNPASVLTEATLVLGQQMTITDAVAADIQEKKPLQLAQFIDTDFRLSEWYQVNAGPVMSPTPAGILNANVNSMIPAGSSSRGPAITIITPRQGATLNTPTVTISGTASSDAVKVVVNDYALTKYIPGSSNWNYLASLGNGNLLKGENIFTAFAEDSGGNRGETATISFIYAGNTNVNASSVSTSTLTVPTVNTPKDFATSESKVLITGTVPSDAQKVVVNGFVLQRYVAGSKAFSYNASAELGTMKEGINVYSIYYVDKAGNKSPAVGVQITYTKGATGSGTAVPG